MSARTKVLGIGMVVGLLAATGCARPEYVYTPESANVRVSGYPGGRYSVPPEAPDGEVRIASFGLAELRADGRKVDAIHVRMVVDNQGSAQPWQVDIGQQVLAVPGRGRVRPIFANTDGQLPVVSVPRRQVRVIDLYYPAPRDVDDEGDLAGFSLMWEVWTPERMVARRTVFDRKEVVDPTYRSDLYLSAGWGPGWGPYWWHHPYPYGFVHRPTVIIRDRPVVIRPGGGRHLFRRER